MLLAEFLMHYVANVKLMPVRQTQQGGDLPPGRSGILTAGYTSKVWHGLSLSLSLSPSLPPNSSSSLFLFSSGEEQEI